MKLLFFVAFVSIWVLAEMAKTKTKAVAAGKQKKPENDSKYVMASLIVQPKGEAEGAEIQAPVKSDYIWDFALMAFQSSESEPDKIQKSVFVKQTQTSSEDGSKGQIQTWLQDGRTQIVNYVVDLENGFQSTITYAGGNSYDEKNKKE